MYMLWRERECPEERLEGMFWNDTGTAIAQSIYAMVSSLLVVYYFRCVRSRSSHCWEKANRPS